MYINVLPGDWGNSCLNDIFCVLDSVRAVFEPHFGIIAPPVTVGRILGDNNPICFRSERLILLNAADMEWNRFAYQFAHEYCHIQIPTDVHPRLRWFEESLCELASCYFLPLVSELWAHTPPYPNWGEYAPNFIKYVRDNIMEKVEPFDVDFSSPQNAILEHLEHWEYDRPKNAYVATKLLPIFIASPTLWSCVPVLSEIPDEMDFASSLRYWYLSVPAEYRASVERIAASFSISAIPELTTV